MGHGAATTTGWLLVGLVALPLLVAALTPLLARLPLVRRLAWLPAFATAIVACAGFTALRLGGGEVELAFPWVPVLRIDFALRLDGLAFLFTLLITGIGAAILAFSAPYLPGDLHEKKSERQQSTFYAYVLFFMGSMLGLVCADDLITLYVFWEATSVSSFLLIGLHLHEERSRAAAIQAFTITAAAGLLLFLAFLCIGATAETNSIALLADAGPRLAASKLAPLVVGGILVGAAAKSAQVPFHIWLPNAMVAPTPVSAYLHSATMVAGGVFLLARLGPLLSPIPGYSAALIALGTVTMLAAGLVATARHGLKEILAWSTISQYGYITLLLGLQAWGAAVFMMATHAVLKAGLFLVAGIATRVTGETDVRRLGGLWRREPILAAVAAVLACGLAGVPLTGGFWMKELFYESISEQNLPWLEAAALTAGVLTFVYMLRFFWRTFIRGETRETIPRDRELLPLLAPPLVLAGIVVLVGVLPGAGAALTDPGAASAAGAAVASSFKLEWPPGHALELSGITFILGSAAVAWLEGRVRQHAAQPDGPFPHPRRPAVAPGALVRTVLGEIGPRRIWEWALPALESLGAFVARPQTGKLVHYLLFLAAVPVAAALWLLPQVDAWPILLSLERVSQASLAFATLALAAVGLSLASALVHSHIAAILMVGGVGFVLALIFSILRAPDVALVQIAVETVTALLLLLVLSRIRITIREESMSPKGLRPRAGRIATVVAAATVGTLVAATSLALQANLGDPALGRSVFPLAEEMQIDAVVTAILVEFRGLDTFGEITVFTAAVLGAVLLLARQTSGRHDEGSTDV